MNSLHFVSILAWIVVAVAVVAGHPIALAVALVGLGASCAAAWESGETSRAGRPARRRPAANDPSVASEPRTASR